MRSALIALGAALIGACVPEHEGGADLEGETWVVIEVPADLHVTRAHLYTRATRPASLVRAHGAEHTLYVLSYDATPEALALRAEDDDTLTLAPPDAPFNEAWALPAPDRWAALDGLESAPIESTDAAAVLSVLERAQVRVPRPDCPELEVVDVPSARGLPPRLEVSMMLPFGAGALLGSTVRYGHDEFLGPTLSYVEPGAEPRALLGPFAFDQTVRPVIDPEGYVEGDRAWVVWGDRIEGGRTTPVLRSITSTLGIGPAQHVRRADGAEPLRPSAMVVAGSGPTRLHLAMTSSSTLERFDEASGLWRVVRSGPNALLACLPAAPTTVLEIFDEQRGLVGFPGGPLLAFDLSQTPPRFTPYAPELQDNYCKTSRALFDAGDELIATHDALWWRRPGVEAFQRVRMMDGFEVNGAATATLHDLAFASLKSLTHAAVTLAIFEREPRRPELPPRHCGTRIMGFDVRQMVRIGDWLLVGGVGGKSVAWIRIAPGRAMDAP